MDLAISGALSGDGGTLAGAVKVQISETISLPAARFSTTDEWSRWNFGAGVRPQLSSRLVPAGEDRFLNVFRVFADGRVQIRLASSGGEPGSSPDDDLIPEFETDGSLRIEAGTDALEVAMGGADASEPYEFTPSNAAEVTAFEAAIGVNANGTLAGTLTLRNFVPPSARIPLSISGTLNGAGGTLAGEIQLVTPISISGSLSGAGGTLAGELDLVTTSVTVDLGADQDVVGDTDYTLPGAGAVTVNNGVGETTYLWERTGGVDVISIDDNTLLSPEIHTPDVAVNSISTWRLTATNNGVSASDTITLTFTPFPRPPAYDDDSSPTQNWRVGTFVFFTLPEPHGNPHPTVTVTGLPAGLNAADLAHITGTPTTAGSGTIALSATNASGTDTHSIPYTIARVSLSLSGSLSGSGGTLFGELTFGTDTPLLIQGTLAGAGGALAGSLDLVDLRLRISGSLAGAGGALAGNLVLGMVGITPLSLAGALSGSGGTLSGSLTLGTKVALSLSGSLTGAGGNLAGSIALSTDTAIAISGSLAGSGGTLAGVLALVDLRLRISGSLAGAGGELEGRIARTQIPMAPPAPRRARAAFAGSAAAGADGTVTLSWEAGDEFPPAYRYEWSADAGRTWTPTGTAALSVTIPNLPPGTYRFRVRGRNALGAGPWSPDSVPIVIPESEIVASSNLVVGQWTLAGRLRGVIDIVADVVRDEIEKPLLDLKRQRRIETAEGVWLDAIARRLGLVRPYTTFGATDDRWGFDDAGVPFDFAPFRGEAANDATIPLPDVVFRRLIRARAITLLSDGSIHAYRRGVEAIDPSATVVDNRDMSVTVTTVIQWQLELADQQQALPRVAGVRIVYRDRERFGFDDAGQPFDQGAWTSV